MDSETYEQFTIQAEILGDALLLTKANETIKGLFYEGNPLSVELPLSVEHEIAETEPGIKNATATNVMKEATTETGLKIRVPLHQRRREGQDQHRQQGVPRPCQRVTPDPNRKPPSGRARRRVTPRRRAAPP